MPEKAKESVEASVAELRKVASKRLILVILDDTTVAVFLSFHARNCFADMWDIKHEHPFSCIDPATASKLLCTTRIKGIMPKGVEVELELLGVKGEPTALTPPRD